MKLQPMIFAFSIVMFTFIPTASADENENAREVLEKVGKKYDTLVDAQVKFAQKVKFEVANVQQTASGILILKKGNKYRVDLEDQTIVTDGQTVWKYSASQKQVLIDHFKMDERSLSPERILTGAPEDYTPALLEKENLGRTETIVLKLVAKRDDAFVHSLKIWVDDATWLIKKVDFVDASGKETEYTVSDIKTNLGLADSRFTYQIPEGVEVVDLR